MSQAEPFAELRSELPNPPRSDDASHAGSDDEGAPEGAPNGAAGQSFDDAMRRDLERRISMLASGSEATFGPLGTGDWIATFLLFVLLPLFLVWIYR
jgi:hypothetical protein